MWMTDREQWCEDHGYYHWKCRDCGQSGWTDTEPWCRCKADEDEQEQDDEPELDDEDAPSEDDQE